MRQLFLRDKIYSKWFILLIDQGIIISTLFFSFALANEYNYLKAFTEDSNLFLALYSLIGVGVFNIFRLNTGIIRYSNTQDILRIFFAVFTVNIAFACIYLFCGAWLPITFNGLGRTLILNFFISSSLLVFLRILVRSLYLSFKKLSKVQKENILIYGTDRHALLIKRAIDLDEASKFNVIGFIDDDIDRSNKYIEQKRVFPFDSIPVVKDKYQVNKVLVAEKSLIPANKINIMEICCNAEIHLTKVQSSEKWLYGKFNSDELKDLNIDELLGREPIKLDKQNILKELRGKRILVTGAAGSIGSEIVRQVLHYHPDLVVLCDHAETPLHDVKLDLEDKLQADKIQICIANIQNKDRMRSIFELYNPDIVFHSAAYKHVPMMEENPSEAVLANVLGTKNLADVCMEFGVEKFIMISTDKAVKPTNVMGASKRLAEIYIQSLNSIQNTKSKTRFITTRFGNVLGSNGSVIPRFKNQIDRRVPITVTHPDITRYFMTIPEAVELVMEAAAMGKGGEIFLFDMGKPIRIIDLAINMIKLAGLRPYEDIDIIFTGLRPGEKIYEELLLVDEKIVQTHHPKIKISQNIPYNYFHFSQAINDLIVANKSGDDCTIVKMMKDILPEYISNNSKYEELDLREAN